MRPSIPKMQPAPIVITSTSVSVILSATIQDITAVSGDPSTDPNAGNITNARVSIVNRDAANAPFSGCASLTPVLVNPADPKTATVSCTTTLTIGAADSMQFTVGFVVGNYYIRDDSGDDTVLTVSKPLTGFITGGGFIVNQATAGQYAGTTGAKSNFGFNVKNNKTGKNLQGNANLILRQLVGSVWKTYQIKTNATDTLVENLISPTTGNAQFLAKANLTDITNPLAPVAIGGGLQLQMTLTDNGEPGSTDSVSFTLWDASTLLYSSNWGGTPPKTVEQILGGGNVQVR